MRRAVVRESRVPRRVYEFTRARRQLFSHGRKILGVPLEGAVAALLVVPLCTQNVRHLRVGELPNA